MAKKTSIFNTVTIPLIIVFQILLNAAAKIFSIKQKYLNFELQIMLNKLANDPSDHYVVQSYLVCAVIIIVFTLMGYLSFRKAEIK